MELRRAQAAPSPFTRSSSRRYCAERAGLRNPVDGKRRSKKKKKISKKKTREENPSNVGTMNRLLRHWVIYSRIVRQQPGDEASQRGWYRVA